jgi:hypothetical protein
VKPETSVVIGGQLFGRWEMLLEILGWPVSIVSDKLSWVSKMLSYLFLLIVRL